VSCGSPFLIAPHFAHAYTTCSRECSSIRRRERITISCAVCTQPFEIQRWRADSNKRFCTNACRLEALNALPRSRKAVGKPQITAKGYVRLHVWDGDEKRTMLEHRYVMEQMLGRRLTAQERVHHKNHDKRDNRPENLVLFGSHAEHIRQEHPELAANLQAAARRASATACSSFSSAVNKATSTGFV
jgi:hypothetical protein